MTSQSAGFIVDIDFQSFNVNRRQSSILVLGVIYRNLSLLFRGKQRFYTVEMRVATIRIFPMRGTGWVMLPILPFALLHETLHFIIAFFTKNHYAIILIPPTLDLLYVPGWLLFTVKFHIWVLTHFVLWAIITIWLELTWTVLLRSNIFTGDFRTVFFPRTNQKQ